LALAGGSQAQADYSQLIWGSAASLSFEDANGDAALAAYSEIIIAALHPGVTDSQVQADFAVGNVSKILTQDFDIYNWAPLGWSGGSGPGSPTYAGGFVDFNLMVPGGLVNVEADVPADNTTMISYFMNKQIYYLAINGTCSVPATPPASDGLPVYTVPSGITEMGIWGTQSGANSVDVFPVGGAGSNPECASDLSDPGYYAVVGQYGVNAGPDFQTILNGLGATDPWPVAELAYVPLPGDANRDGRVDINDLTIVLAHYGQTGTTWSQGEFTGDGTVDINDLTIVLAHYGQSEGTSAAGVAEAPEPASWAMLAAALSAAAWAVARRRN
jgi:hypothetical protein